MRETITEERLLELINEAMDKSGVCEDTRMGSLMKTVELDETGCNWSFNIAEGVAPGPDCQRAIHRIGLEFRARYNLE